MSKYTVEERVDRLERIVAEILRSEIHSHTFNLFGKDRHAKDDWLVTLKSWDGRTIVTREELLEMIDKGRGKK